MNKDLRLNLIKAFEKGLRYDGRKLDQFREISVETGVIKTAEGSARVKIGETEVIVGIKTEVSKPYPDAPDKGTIMVGAELYPLSSPDFDPGPPSIESIELARVIDRGIRESHALDFKKLCIEKGEQSWIICIDICPINNNGNLFDAASLGAIAALKNARFPEFDGTNIDYKKLTDVPFPLSREPIEVTVLKIGKFLIVDPLPEEEASADARLTVATTEDGKLCAMQKGGDSPLAVEDIKTMVELAMDKTKELRSFLGGN